MITLSLARIRQLRTSRRFAIFGASAAVAALIVFGLIFGSGSPKPAASKAAKPVASGARTLTDTAAEASAAKGSANAASDGKTASPAAAPNTTTVLKTTSNTDGTTTKQIAVTQSIPFVAQTQNQVNLKRGATQVQAGQNGIEAIVYSVTYNQNGKEVSRKTLSDTITKQPVAQVTNVGVSDFNLNTDTWDGTEFGEMCLPADYNTAGDGCVGVASDRYMSAVEISGTFYISCVSSATGVCGPGAIVNVQPVIAIHSDSTFMYQGITYRADPRAGGGESAPLTVAVCSQYALACGRW